MAKHPDAFFIFYRKKKKMTLQEFYSEWNSAEDSLLVHTSGSTGAPKPMMVEKQRMLNSARRTCDFLSLKRGDTAFLCMPLDFIAGKMVVVRTIERNMKLITVPPSNHPFRTLIENCRKKGENAEEMVIDFAAMVPSQVFCSLSVPEERKMLERVKHLIIGGGAIDPELSDALQNLPNNVWSTYGMTETLSHIALRRVNGREASEWYEPFDSVNISLLPDENSKEGRGLLVIDAPEVSVSRLVTNDICELHADGRRFRILGRKDNVICSGGIKLQIEEIEAALHPFLNFPFCISRRHDRKFGEVAVLLLAPKGSESDIALVGPESKTVPECSGSNVALEGSESKAALSLHQKESILSLLSSAFQTLPKYSVPKDIVFVPEIPLTATGKINRMACESLAASNSQK